MEQVKQNAKVGDTVPIYQKPFTKEDFEGTATIKKIHRRYDTHIDCEVEFENEPGDIYFRAVANEEQGRVLAADKAAVSVDPEA